MSASVTSLPMSPSRAPQAILLGGGIAGILDVIAAFLNMARFGVSPTRVLQAIASGVMGAAAYRGGFWAAALGLCLHFLIAFGAAAVYFGASHRLRVLVDHAVICGLVFGVVVYLVMNFIVLPLSAIAFKQTFPLSAVIIGLSVHMLLVGLPIALAVRKTSL